MWGKMGFIQTLGQESRPSVGIGEEEHEGGIGQEGSAELLPRAVPWRGWDAPNPSLRIHLPWQGGAAVCLIPICPSSPIFKLISSTSAHKCDFFFFPPHQLWAEKHLPKLPECCAGGFLGRELFPGAQSVALFALPAIEELSSALCLGPKFRCCSWALPKGFLLCLWE